jgi:hypothetical protein
MSNPYDPYGDQPYQPTSGSYPPQGSTNGLAIAAMILSILGVVSCCGFGIAGAIMGQVALGQVRERNEDGEGFAKAGIYVGWASVGIWVLGAIVYLLFLGGIVALGWTHPTPYHTY